MIRTDDGVDFGYTGRRVTVAQEYLRAKGDNALGRACQTANFVIVIPAYRPVTTLVSLVMAMRECGAPVIVVDDGSGPGFAQTFGQAKELSGVVLLRHDVNRGKGMAIKTAIDFALREFPGFVGIVTADADGQHLPADVARVGRELEQNPRSLVMGARSFTGSVPWRSRLGNSITRRVMRVVVGQALRDTQTGLRGLPMSFARRTLELAGARYEFETEMLMLARRSEVPIREVGIETVYLHGNGSSHFRPVVDSFRIYRALVAAWRQPCRPVTEPSPGSS